MPYSRASIACVLALLFCGSSWASSSPEEYAQLLFQRLAGRPLSLRDPRYSSVLAAVREGRLEDAASVAIEDDSFYGVTLKTWVAQWTSREETSYAALNDLQAMIIGAVRDDLDARTLLTG